MAKTREIRRKKLSPGLTAEIISDLGGGVAVSEILKVSKPAVSTMKKNGLPWIYVEFFRLKYPHLASVRKTYDEI